MKALMPSQVNCSKVSLLIGSCEPAKPWQMLYLYVVLYITVFGVAGIRPCVSSFGAVVAFTMVVYIQMEHGLAFAFASLAIAMAISNMVFFVGTPLYRHRLLGGSPLTRVDQVLVAAFRKRNASFSSSEYVGLYELPAKRSAIKGSGKITHTDDFRWLDKAALQLKEDGDNPTPWKLCTVTQDGVHKNEGASANRDWKTGIATKDQDSVATKDKTKAIFYFIFLTIMYPDDAHRHIGGNPIYMKTIQMIMSYLVRPYHSTRS